MRSWPLQALLIEACGLLACISATHAQHPVIQSVADLQRAMYTEMPLMSNTQSGGDACVRLLNATGTLGCAAAGRDAAQGRLLRLEALLPSPDDYPGETAFLLPPSLLADFLNQCWASPTLLRRVRGVLVEPGTAPRYSQAAAAPLAEFALQPGDRSYAWNPAGRGLSVLDLPFPVFLLDNTTAVNAAHRAAHNNERSTNGAVHYARMLLQMDGTGNSSTCLAAGTCLPLGGHSLLATLPPLPTPAARGSGGAEEPASDDGLPALWILSQFDSVALFHEATAGADAPMSGLIALLAAAQLLGRAVTGNATAGQPPVRYHRRLVFAALGGEPWGLMGSKRLLWELHSSNNSMVGLSLAEGRVVGVLEVTQVGRTRQAADGGPAGGIKLYTHTPDSGPAAEFLGALQAAAAATREAGTGGVNLSPASEVAPGLPPTASAGSFVRVAGSGGGGSQLPAVLLSGFDATFQGATFQTQYDTLETVDADSITAAAVVLARAAHSLAQGGGGGSAAVGEQEEQALAVDYAAVKLEVEGLMQCLLNASVGLNCPLAAALMSPVRGGHVAHYIGILHSITADAQTPDPGVKSDVERFIWNYLAFATAPGAAPPGSKDSRSGSSDGDGGSSASVQRCQPMNATACLQGLVCAGSRSMRGPDGLGVCLNATVRYILSYSTSLTCDACDGSRTLYDQRWRLSDVAAQWEQQHSWPPDPLWTESNWPSGMPALTLYLREAPRVEDVLLVAGLAMAAASFGTALTLRAAYQRKLKRQ